METLCHFEISYRFRATKLVKSHGEVDVTGNIKCRSKISFFQYCCVFENKKVENMRENKLEGACTYRRGGGGEGESNNDGERKKNDMEEEKNDLATVSREQSQICSTMSSPRL